MPKRPRTTTKLNSTQMDFWRPSVRTSNRLRREIDLQEKNESKRISSGNNQNNTAKVFGHMRSMQIVGYRRR